MAALTTNVRPLVEHRSVLPACVPEEPWKRRQTRQGQFCHYEALVAHLAHLAHLGPADIRNASDVANRSFLHQGVTFTVYSDTERGTERIFPFDVIPWLIPSAEWDTIKRGLQQRIGALNHFIHDIYHEQQILHDHVVPRGLVVRAQHFRREAVGVDVPHNRYIHVVGSHLVRDADGNYLVLEDNLRSPSGVSYVLANRTAMSKIFLGLRPDDV